MISNISIFKKPPRRCGHTAMIENLTGNLQTTSLELMGGRAYVPAGRFTEQSIYKVSCIETSTPKGLTNHFGPILSTAIQEE